MAERTGWVARLTPLGETDLAGLLRLPLGLDVWEREADALVVLASESQLAEIERRGIAQVERLATIAEYLALHHSSERAEEAPPERDA